MDMRWKIFYVDGGTFSSQDGEPQDAPGWGVAAIAQEDEVVNIQIHQGNDFYCFDEKFAGWYGLDYFGFAQYVSEPGHKIIKLGDVMPTHKYRELLTTIRDDPDLPNKYTRHSWERPF
jgi:hypothetical protein